jgi:glucose/arabinose dehydrogenase
MAGSVDGFDRPWDLRFLPDGTPLVTERPGRLATVVEGRRQVVAEVPGVVARGEGGLMGLAIDPRFEDNRRIYLCFAAGSGGTVTDVRVVRFVVSQDLDRLTGAEALVTGIPAGAGNRHLGCRLEVGPDGMLWITTGDAVLPSAPQDPGSRAGKVLRATLDGDPAPNNPGGPWDPYVYTVGHRNAQGLSFRPDDGAAFAVEHGTGCDDEINLLAPGANYGWDPVGPGGRYAEDAPMTSPRIVGAVPAAWSSGCPTIAPSGAEFITGDQWGSWAGRLAVAVLKDEQLLVAAVPGGEVTGSTTALSGELGRLRTVRNGLDGSLWLTVDASPGEVVRIVPQVAQP